MDINNKLKSEIDDLDIKYGISSLLKNYGKLSITGSYIYNLMAWRDYDLVLEVPELTLEKVYSLIQQIGISINPSELKLLNNTDAHTQNRPNGYWVGIYIDSWKIDLWLMNKTNAEKEIAKTAQLCKLLENIDKPALIAIKQELVKDKDYHLKFSSVDLYNAFVYGNVRSTKDFYTWLSNKQQ